MAPAAAPAAAPSAARRDRLPDIEEINSSLRVSAPAARPDRAAAPDRRGFRLGLGGGLLIAALLALPYVYAPRIASALPWTVPVLRPYVAAVDAARSWLDERMRDLLEALGTAPEGGAASGSAAGSATPTLSAAPEAPPQVQVEPPAIPLPAAE
ncbi:hypothetical protein ruthe_01770 [Rubellimicrobium thermophilum DSM 16684]|uniref:Uncharacterized protein n=1 Tax=Rubellimicrobium thermophilum DSM 16684 TaxID=1123069 RepID=S9QZS2_9RHOB|nr:hypothetical protein ruthe_01770 [Rubellimicrobium thermophilum DSM 16684]